MVKVIFINPNTRSYHNVLLTVLPPLGILSISSVLLKNGIDVKVIDADIHNYTHEDILRELQYFNPDIIGITMTTFQKQSAFDTAKYIRSNFRNSIIVAGGYHPSAVKDVILKECKSIDCIVFGEGEITFLEMVRSIEKSKGLKGIEGLIFREGDTIISNPPRARIQNLDTLPYPALHLVQPLSQYPGAYPVGCHPTIHIMASRGCPFNCTFCCKAIWGKDTIFYSPEYILKEIKWLQDEFGIREIFFTDDTLNLNRNWFEKICNGIISESLNKKCRLKAPFRANERLLDINLLKIAKKAGFWMIFFGVESGNQNILNIIKKGLTLGEIERAFQLTKKAQILTYASLMVGNLGESVKTVKDTIKFAKKIDPDFVGFALALPLPGSEFYTIAKKNNLFKVDFEDYFFNTSAINLKGFSEGQVEELTKRAVDELKDYKKSPIRKFRKLLKYGIKSLKNDSNSYTDYYPIANPPEIDQLNTEITMGVNDGDALGFGWHLLENWPPNIRWTKHTAVAYLKNDETLPFLSFKIVGRNPLCEQSIKIVTGYNDIQFSTDRSVMNIVKFKFKNKEKLPYIKLLISTRETWIPDNNMKNGDCRELGVAIEKIWLSKT
jgi:radical SAM superfamily enzyme YgiQ (UPF0313 family)